MKLAFLRILASSLLLGAVALGSFAGCRNMKRQPNYRAMTPNGHFADGATARHAPANTVVHGAQESAIPFASVAETEARTAPPFPLDRALLERGRDRYDIFCAVCHGPDGYGKGIVVRRGFPTPPSFHDERLRQATVGHFYTVMTRGFGVMYSYADRVSERDRWAIAAYMRALQRSQNASLADLPVDRQAQFVNP